MNDDILDRLQRLEDERAIAKLIASYGPSVDSGSADDAAKLWAVDGSYDVEGWTMGSRADVHAMVSSPSHQNLVTGGCCHFLGPAVVTITDDTAVAVCESLVLIRDGEGYRVWRATANHFALQRIDGSWRIAKRKSRVLDGNPEAHRLLIAGVAGRETP